VGQVAHRSLLDHHRLPAKVSDNQRLNILIGQFEIDLPVDGSYAESFWTLPDLNSGMYN